MPRKNSEDRGRPGAYHVYNRAIHRRLMFRDDEDRKEFLALLGRCAAMHAGTVEVIAYCPMGTHFHLILWQKRTGGMGVFMASFINAYVRYYNRRHGTNGRMFPGPYRARRLKDTKAFKWAIAYVHDNHRDGVAHRFSSHGAFVDEQQRPGWLAVKPALKIFGGPSAYEHYIAVIAR